MNCVIKVLVAVLLQVYVLDVLCLSVPTKHSNIRTARGMSIFNNNAGSKYNEEMLKIEHENLKLKTQELELESFKFNRTVEMKMMELNNSNEMKMMELNNSKEMKMMELNNSKEMKMMELNNSKENDRINNAISVFAIISFLIFSAQLRDGLLGKITTSTSLLQSFYDLGIGIKSLMGKISAKLYLSSAIIVAIIVIISRQTDHMLKGLYGTWHIICMNILRIIRR